VHGVAFFKEEIGEVCTVLTSDTGDESDFVGVGHVLVE
jgi:hypothetical protein